MTDHTKEQEHPAVPGRGPAAVSATGLAKSFGDIEAVKGVTAASSASRASRS